MVRQFVTTKMKPSDLTYLYPAEIISRLRLIAQDVGINPEMTVGKAVQPDQELDALDQLVNGFFLPEIEVRTTPLSEKIDHLPDSLHQHLAHLLHTALVAAQKLEQTQPQTPLGFPKGRQGVLSNLLSASWIDLTMGGTVEVKWTPLD